MFRSSLKHAARNANMRWLMSLAHMEPSPVSRWVALRAALAIGLPSAVGLALDQSAAAALVALGALPAITGDNGGPYRNRALSIGATVFGGALGYFLGTLIAGHGLWTSAAMTLLVLAASLVGTFNNIAAVSTLQFAAYVIVGASLTSTLPPWLPSVLVGAGGLFGLALTLTGWVVHPTAPERAAVAMAYRKLAAMFAAIGTSHTMSARRDMEAAMTTAYDTVLAARRSAAGPSPRLARLAAQLQACTPLTNTALELARAGRVLPRDCARVMNRLADRVENDATPDPREDIAALRHVDMAPLADALAQVQPLLDGGALSEADAFAGLPPARPRTPWRVLARTYRPGPTTLRYLVRLGLCLIAAEAVALAASLPRSYWVPLIVVVVFKPNFGSVFARALQSCAGSVVGVAISATVLALDRNGIVSLLTVAGLASLLPWSVRRNYGLFSAILLPILMLLIGALQPGSWPIALARLIDVAVAAGIVLLVGYLPWIRIERGNLDNAVAAAMDTLAAYLNTVFQADPTSRHDLRASAYARLSDLRIALQRGLSEPRLVSRRALAWWPVEVALERVANAISDTAWSLPADQAAPSAAELAQLAASLHQMSAAVAQGAAMPAAAIASTAPALRDVAAQIEALRAALAGPDFAAAPGKAIPDKPANQV
ncbi:FUSC family protein [Achromobacter sp. K91]|uniref:FUSC family protein n=1 Tax=Achromobacter TaxID=222 RepID=UPI000E66F7B9|nr:MULTISPECIES: FUSC family protein [Achromobacter]MDQ1760611.1 FUSC family protein [Achromobacter aegrifaciens]RIJ06395.1 FUSC family protein [Achromobacter sp. K91]